MALLRIVFFLLLVGAGISFVCFVVTGQTRYKVYGLRVLRWTVIAALVFFAVLFVQRIG